MGGGWEEDESGEEPGWSGRVGGTSGQVRYLNPLLPPMSIVSGSVLPSPSRDSGWIFPTLGDWGRRGECFQEEVERMGRTCGLLGTGVGR